MFQLFMFLAVRDARDVTSPAKGSSEASDSGGLVHLSDGGPGQNSQEKGSSRSCLLL